MMLDDAPAWEGPVAHDPTLGRSPAGSIRWALADGGPIALTRPVPEAADLNMLSLWVHSERMTAARVELSLPAPDADNRFFLTFSVEWTGWNHLQLEKDVFRAAGAPRWEAVQGMTLSAEEGPIPPTVLHIDEVTWTDASPRWEMEHGELMVDPLYSGMFSPPARWQPDEATRALPAGAVRLTRRWNALAVERQRGTPQATYTRQFNLDIRDIRALRIQAAHPTTATLAMTALIDGEEVQILAPATGADNWDEYVAPVSGERLEALSIHCADAPDLPPSAPAHVEYHFHFITAETQDFDPPQFPAQMPTAPLAEELAAREPLLEADLPAWLYFGAEDIPALREKVRDGTAADMFAQLQARADRFLGQDPSVFAGPYYPTRGHEWLRPWYASQPLGDMAQTCAFMYVLTDDLRYAEQARRALMTLAALDKWNYGMISRYPVGWGGHGGPFCEASIGAQAALAYNWIYNILQDDERAAVEEKMLWGSWYWLNDYIDTRSYIRGMNQGPWFNFGALIQAMVLAHRYPWLEQFYAKYEANMEESIGLNYLECGSNTEGAAYWDATTRYIARSLPLLARISGRSLEDYVPGPFFRSIEMPIYMRSMVSEDFNVLGVNDGNYSRWNPSDTGLFFAAALQQPMAQWAWEETAGKTRSFGDLVMSIIWHHDWGQAPRPELDIARQFLGAAGTVLRSSWDVGAVLFAMQTGVWGHGGHQHHDKNSFVLEAYGERLCPDKGVPTYGHPMGPYFQHTVSHNAITIDGANQRPDSPRVLRFEHSETHDILESDATGNYPGATRVIRRVLFMRPAYFVLVDEVKTRNPASIEFNLHTFGSITVDGDAILFTGTNADLLVKMIHPSVFTHSITHTRRHPNEPPVYDLQLAPPRPVTEMSYVTVLYPLRKGRDRPDISAEKTEAGAVIHVDGDTIDWTLGEGFSLR